MKVTIEIRKREIIAASVKRGNIRIELALLREGLIEVDTTEYRRIMPGVDVQWSKTRFGRAHNLEPVEFTGVPSRKVTHIAAANAGTTDMIGIGTLWRPRTVNGRLVFGPGEIVTTMV